VADLLTEIRRDIDRRLEELRPVVDEVQRLEQAQKALDGRGPSHRRQRPGRTNSSPARARMSRARSQEIDRQVLALLAEDSAQRPAALALLSETSVGSMNSRLNRLAREGKLRKRKRGRAVRFEVQLGELAVAS
jgi:hypothetical protein